MPVVSVLASQLLLLTEILFCSDKKTMHLHL